VTENPRRSSLVFAPVIVRHVALGSLPILFKRR
jgi:hypothetical protein